MFLEYLVGLWPSSLTSQTLMVGTLIATVAYNVLKKRRNLPPGPPGWPIIGNLIELRKGNMFKVLETWSKTYGPVMTVGIGTTKFVVLSNIEVVMEALVTRQADFAGRAFFFSFDHFTQGGNDIAGANYGPRWKLHRKLASKAIRSYLIGDALPKKLTEALNISIGLMLKEEGPFDPYPYLSLAVFNVINGMCFGKLCPNPNDQEFKTFFDAINTFNEASSQGFLEDQIPPLRFFPTSTFKTVESANNMLTEIVRKGVQEHRDTFMPGETRDLTDAILQAQRDAEEDEDPVLLSQITDTHVVQTVLDVHFAGIDTSRNTLHWTLLAMALHPDIQAKVHDEVDTVIGKDLDVKMADRESLPYTEACLYEAMRIRPVVPTGFPHVTLCDTSVGGFDIPKNTNVMINHHALHFDTDKWDNVNEFQPERFLDASGKMGPKPEAWLPFSAGRRVCLGETIAKPELHLMVASIMRACSVSLAPGESHDFEPTPGVTNLPGTYNIVVKSRV